MFIIHEKQSRRTLRLIWLTAIAGTAVIAGMLLFNHWMVQRASEDAYATMLWKQSSKTAARLENYMQAMLTHLGRISRDDFTEMEEEPATLEYAVDIAALERLDNQGRIIGRWTPPHADTPELPEALTEAQTQKLREMQPVLTSLKSVEQKSFIALYLPIITDEEMNGATGIVIPAETVVWRCFPAPDEPLISGFALHRLIGETIIESSRAHAADHLEKAAMLRSEPLFTEPERGMEAYRLLSHAGTRYLSATAPAMLPGHTIWLVETAMPYSTVYLAPRALFKSLVILAAWLLPLYGFLALFTIYRIIRTVESEETTRKRSELDQAQSHLLALIEILPDMVYLAEPSDSMSLVFVSNRCEKITGYTAIELITDPRLWPQLITPEDRARIVKTRQTVLAESTGRTIRYNLQTKSGKTIPAQEQITVVSDNEGNTIHLMGIIAPLTHADSDAVKSQASEPDTAGQSKKNNPVSAPDAIAGTSSRGHILLADDDHLLVSLCTQYLTRAGYGITPAYNGIQAVEVFKSRPNDFDVIILDMIMPKMSGLEAIEHLRGIRSDIKIIGISGYSKDGSEWDLFRHNVCAFLPKPFQPEELIQKISKILN